MELNKDNSQLKQWLLEDEQDIVQVTPNSKRIEDAMKDLKS